MKYRFQILTILFMLIISNQAISQIALAVSKNENGSSVKYSLETGKTMDEAVTKAQKMLSEQGMQNIEVLRSTEETGHNLSSGFYVLIISSRKILGGKFFISYGLGASAKSKEEAMQRALVHLKEYDWGYERNFGYAIEKEGTIENFYVKEEKEKK
ncbi:MAG: hypothetical protein U0W24_20705 [Bacteroidales bacterium]